MAQYDISRSTAGNGSSTYGDINQRTAAWAAAEMLSHAEPVTCLSKFGQHKPIPRNKAQVVKFRRAVPYPVSNVPLAEGVTPTARKIQYEDVTVTMRQYGDVAELTDVVHDQAEDPVLKDMSQLAGEQAAETVELVTWGIIRAGTSIIYTNGSARSDVNTVIDNDDVRTATRYLKAQRGKMHTSMLSGSVNIGTVPIEAAFIAFGHTDVESDFRNLTGFTPTAEYGSRKTISPYELGAVETIRAILSPVLDSFADAGGAKGTTVSTTGTSSDVYPVVVCAKESYGCCPLKGSEAITPMVLNPGVARGGDPLGQRGTVGWKTYFAAIVLNDTWMVRIECAVSALKSVV